MQEEKHIVYVTHSLKKGSHQRHLINLIKSGVSQGYSPLVINLFATPDSIHEWQHLNIKTFHLEMNKLWKFPSNLRIVIGWIRAHNVRLIYSLMHSANFLALLLKTLSRPSIRLVWGLHDTPGSQQKNPLTGSLQHFARLLSDYPDHIILFSHYSYSCYREQGYPAEKMSVIPGGVVIYPENTPYRADYRQSVRQELALPPGTRLIGSLSRYSHEKDIPCLLEAFSIACQNRTDICLLLAGEGMEPANLALVRHIKHYQLETKVRLLGHRSDAQRLIQAMDLATSSNRSTAFPWFIAEAMSLRIPCVATDVGDTSFLLQRNEQQLVPPGNPIKLASTWLKILALSGAERWALVNTAWKHVNAEFSLEQHAAQHACIYRKLCY